MIRSTFAVLLLLCSTLLYAAVPGDVDQFDPARNAAQDIARALREAQSSGRRVLLDVGGEWCSWCHLLDRSFAANAELQALREKNFVWVKVNVSPENKNEALLSRYPKFLGYPHFFVLDAEGKVLQSQDTSVLEEGKGYNVGRLRDFLIRWAPPQ
jgi:thioredoxin-related protein